MLNELSQTSRSSTIADNRFQELRYSTMTSKPFSKSQSLTIPVPRLIIYRFVHITPVSENPPSFSWLAFQGVSDYIVQLLDSKGIVWRETVHSREEQTVTYFSETFLEPGKDYIFTVEIDRQYSCVDSCDQQQVNIAKDVNKGIQKIEKTCLPRQFVAPLDGLLIANEEILDIIQGAIRQGSNSEIICFLADFLGQNSAFELLTNARSSDDILDALGEFASQLAAANMTLGKYLNLSGVQKSLAKILVSKGVDLALFAQNLEGAFQFGKRSFLMTSCDRSLCTDYFNQCIRNGGSREECLEKMCDKDFCRGCDECVG